MKYTIEQIRAAAMGACFYVTPGGMWLRVEYTDTDGFSAADEASGESYMFSYDKMLEDNEEPEFHHIVRTKLVRSESAEWFEP